MFDSVVFAYYDSLEDYEKDRFWEFMDEIFKYSKRFKNLGNWPDLYDMEEYIFALVDMLCYNDNYHVEPE